MADLSRVETIFFRAIEQATPEALEALLKSECGDDADLRERVERVLSAHARSSDFLKSQWPLNSPAPTLPASELDVTLDTSRPKGEQDDEAEVPHADVLALLSPPTAPNAIGRLGHYDVIEILGSGGFGTVVKGFDDRLHRMVAIKVMAPSLATSSPPRKRFLREARSAAAVRHDNIVSIYAVEDNPVPYLVMEYIAGHTLQKRLDASGPLEISDVLRLGHQIALGLAAAHVMNIVHRDIKPGNILIESSSEKIKITDFGLARAADDASLTRSGVIMGTPLYMSPEQANGQTVDYRSDLFSLGSVFYAMCCGRAPFRAPNTVAVLQRLVTDTPRPIPEIIDGIPQWLVDLITRLQAKDPEQRVISAKEVAEEFERGLDQLKHTGSAGEPARVVRRATGDNPAPRVQPKPGSVAVSLVSPMPASRKQRRVGAFIAATVLLCIVLIAISFVLRRQTDQKAQLNEPTWSSSRNEAPSISFAEYVPSTEALAWEKRVSVLPAEQQLAEIVARLKQLNPNFDGKVESKIQNSKLTSLTFRTDDVTNISPVRAATNLIYLGAAAFGAGKLIDIRPIQGMKLTSLTIAGNPELSDIAPLRRMPLQSLWIDVTKVKDLKPLEGMKLTALSIDETLVDDLSPLRDMPIQTLSIRGPAPIPVKDWAPLLTLKELAYLWLSSPDRKCLKTIRESSIGSLDITFDRQFDLSSLEGSRVQSLTLRINDSFPLDSLAKLPLTFLAIVGAKREDKPIDLAPLKEFKLKHLAIHGTPVKDLAPLRETLIEHLRLIDTEVDSLDPLKQMRLKRLEYNGQIDDADLAALRSIKSLEVMNGKAVAEFFKEYADRGLPAVKTPRWMPSSDPASAAWERRVMALPAAEQVDEIVLRLKLLNPGFDGQLEHKIENGVIRELSIESDHVTNISPVHVARGLVLFKAMGLDGKPTIEDISALRGLKLEQVILGNNRISDLRPLHGMPVRFLALSNTQVTDLKPLEGMRLGQFNLSNSPIREYAPLRNVSVDTFDVRNQSAPAITDWASILAIRNLKQLVISEPSAAALTAVKNSTLTFLGIYAAKQPDISPLKGARLRGLSLICENWDLPALKDLSITKLYLNGKLPDLSPLKGLNLKELALHSTEKLPDLSVLKGSKITWMSISAGGDLDLAQLAGSLVETLDIQRARVKDFSPLSDIPIKVLTWTNPENDKAIATLRGVKTLETINGKPAAAY